MTQPRKCKYYHKLVQRLRRAGFKKTGKYKKFNCSGNIASYLQYLFKTQLGVVYKNDLIKFDILDEEEGLTNEFLSLLVQSDFIKWNLEINKRNSQKIYQTYMGEKLGDILEKDFYQEKAAKVDVDILRAEIEKINKKLNLHEKCLNTIVEYLDPPITETKLNQYLLDILSLKGVKRED